MTVGLGTRRSKNPYICAQRIRLNMVADVKKSDRYAEKCMKMQEKADFRRQNYYYVK